MTRTLRNVAMAAFALTALTACPQVPGMSNIPGTGGTLTPGTGTTTTPTTGGGTGAAACAREKATGTPAPGLDKHGAYKGQLLPDGWTNLADEAAVTDAIRKQDGGADWNCFQKFYGGAVTVYNGKK